MFDTVRAVSFEHVGNIGGHGGGDGTGDAVVDDGLTKESVSNGVGFLTWHLVERAFTRRW